MQNIVLLDSPCDVQSQSQVIIINKAHPVVPGDMLCSLEFKALMLGASTVL